MVKKKKAVPKKQTKSIETILAMLSPMQDDIQSIVDDMDDISNRLFDLEEGEVVEEDGAEWQIKEVSKKRKGDTTYYVYCTATDDGETVVAFPIKGFGAAESIQDLLNDLDQPRPDLLTDMDTKGQKL